MLSHGDWVQERVVVRKHFTSKVSTSDHDAPRVQEQPEKRHK